MTISNNGKYLLSGGTDGSVILWDLSTLTKVN